LPRTEQVDFVAVFDGRQSSQTTNLYVAL